MLVVKIIGLVNGEPTSFDGKYLKEYDPSRDGKGPNGEELRAHIVVTEDRAKAKKFKDVAAFRELWMRIDPRQPYRADGKPNRPLTAFNVEVAPE